MRDDGGKLVALIRHFAPLFLPEEEGLAGSRLGRAPLLRSGERPGIRAQAEAKESAVRLTGWSRSRRVIVLRRRVKGALGLSQIGDAGAPQLCFAEIGAATEIYEYSVLVTSLDEATEAFGQLYRDRGDGENIFDEMKNQWGWGGFTTHDLARCRLAARLMALFYDWWTIFVRLVDPSLHREAITSRPLFLSAIATRTRHARQTTIRVTSSHAKAKPAARALAAAAGFLRGLAKSAEQLTRPPKWRAILSRAFQALLVQRQCVWPMPVGVGPAHGPKHAPARALKMRRDRLADSARRAGHDDRLLV